MAGGGGAAAAWVARGRPEVGGAAVTNGRVGKPRRRAGSLGVGGIRSSKAKRLPKAVSVRWRVGATRRGRAINSRHPPAAPVRLSRPPLSAGPPLHLSRPRTAAPGARFATNGRHCRTTCNGSESFVPALVRPFVVRPTSPCSVRGFQFPINSPSNRPTV